MRKEIVVCLVFMLVISSSLVSATVVDNKETNKEKENKVYYLNSNKVDSDIFYEEIESCSVSIGKNENAEEINIEYNEDVTVKKDGNLNLDITMEISSKKLVELYKESLGVPQDLEEIDMEIPYQTKRKITLEKENGEVTEKEIIEPVKDKFLEGVSEEQRYLYGFHVTNFLSSKIYSKDPEDNLFIDIKAEALPYVTNVKNKETCKQIKIESSPRETVNSFITEQMQLSKTMIESFPGNQYFTKNVKINFDFPDSAKIINLEKNKKYFDFGGASFVSTLSEESEKISFTEDWTIFEGQQITNENEIESLFDINCEITKPAFDLDFKSMNYDFDMSAFNDDPWSWSADWDVIDLDGESGGVSYSVDVDLYLTLSGTLHVDLGKQKIYADAGIEAGLEVDVTISGAWEKTWNLLGGMMFSQDNYAWRGMQVMAVTVHVEPEAELYVSVEGSVHVYLNPEADFSIRAGGDVDFQWGWPPAHFTPIFGCSLGGSFEKTIELSCSATVRPSLGFALSLLVFEIIGPRITPEIYLEGLIGYDSTEGAYYNAELAFDLHVGIQFTRFVHYNWPDPIYHKKIKSWKGTFNPQDISAPTTTLYMGPKRNGYVGPVAFFWFKAKDGGPEGKGIDVTKFKIPEANDNSWKEFDNTLTHLIITEVENYRVKYYSKDIDANTEDTKTQNVQADLNRPDVGINFEGDFIENGNDNYEVLKDSTKVYLLGKEVGSRKTDVRVWYKAVHESGYETEWRYNDYYDGDKWYGWGLTFGDLGEWTVTWVAEDGVWNVRSYEATFEVKDTFVPPSIDIEFPRRGDLIILNNYLGNLPFSFSLFLACTSIGCSAYAGDSDFAKVEFSCGGKTVTDTTKSGGYYSASINNVPQGRHTIVVDAYDSQGEPVAGDSVGIIKFG